MIFDIIDLATVGYSYLIFAGATAITAYLSIYRPTMREILEDGYYMPEHEHPIMAGAVFILMAFILAPFLVVPSLKGESSRYKEVYKNRLLEEDEEDE